MRGKGGGRCSSCQKPIKWAKTENGKPMPLDPRPNQEGNVELVNGIAKVLSGLFLEEARRTNTVLHMPHFATCSWNGELTKNQRGRR